MSKEKPVLHFRLSRQKHAKTLIRRLKQNPKEILYRGGEENFTLCHLHLISWRCHWTRQVLQKWSFYFLRHWSKIKFSASCFRSAGVDCGHWS